MIAQRCGIKPDFIKQWNNHGSFRLNKIRSALSRVFKYQARFGQADEKSEPGLCEDFFNSAEKQIDKRRADYVT